MEFCNGYLLFHLDIISMFLNFIRKNAVENFVKLISIPIEQEKKKKDE